MRPLRALAVLALCLLAGTARGDGHGAFLGIWQGRVSEAGIAGRPPAQYAVTIEILPGGAQVDYPDLACGGILRLVRRGDGWMGFRDRLSYGLERCEGNGLTELRLLRPGLLRYRWYDAAGRLRAEGRLQRRRQWLVEQSRDASPPAGRDGLTEIGDRRDGPGNQG